MEINQFLLGRQNTDDSESDLGQTDVKRAINMVTATDDNSGRPRREPLRSFQAVPLSLPSGLNVTIGSVADEPNSKIYFFNWNISGNHHICEYDHNTRTSSILLQWTGLGFKRHKPITGAGVLEGKYLFWTDAENQPMFLDIQRAKTDSEYRNNINTKRISYYRPHPIFPAWAERSFENGRNNNFVDEHNFQFSYRWKFKNKVYSILAPYSRLYNGYTVSSRNGGSAFILFNRYTVYAHIPADIQGEIEGVEFLFRKGNLGDWQIIEYRKLTTLSVQNVLADYQGQQILAPFVSTTFYNNSAYRLLAGADSSKIIENIPRVSGAMALMNSRIFTTQKQVDRDLDGFTLSIGATVRRETDTENGGQSILTGDIVVRQVLKQGGKYSVGVVAYDELGRPTPVLAKTEVDVPRELLMEQLIPFGGSPEYEGLPRNRYVADIALSGDVPSWVKGIQLVRTRELYYSTYYQSKANIYFYIQEYTEGTQINSDEFAWKGKLFKKAPPRWQGNTYDSSYMAVQVASNVPFQADTNCYVSFITRFGTEALYDQVRPVMDVDGDLLLVDMGGVDWSKVTTGSCMVEVYKRNAEQDEIFYETGMFFPVETTANIVTDVLSVRNSAPQSVFVLFGNTLDRYESGDLVFLSTSLYTGLYPIISVTYIPTNDTTELTIDVSFVGNSTGTVSKALDEERTFIKVQGRPLLRGDAWVVRTHIPASKQRFLYGNGEPLKEALYSSLFWDSQFAEKDGHITYMESPSPVFGVNGEEVDIYDENAERRRNEIAETENDNYERKERARATASAIGSGLVTAGAAIATTGVGILPGAVVAGAGLIVTALGGLFAKRKRPTYIPRFLERKQGYVPDYLRADSDIGRPNVEFPDYAKESRANVVTFSNPYLNDTNENGIHRMEPLDEYPLDINRGDIISLRQVDDVLLALHPSVCTALYIQQAFIRANQQDATLIKTEGLIGDDRPLSSSRYGLSDPLAIVVMQGRAYWYDRMNAELVQYSNDGVNPLSTMYRNKELFLELTRQFEGYKRSAKVVTGYLPQKEMLFVSFLPADLYSDIELQARFKGIFNGEASFLDGLVDGDVVVVDNQYKVYKP